jgi:hypothetical protein
MDKMTEYLMELTDSEDLIQCIASLCGAGAITLGLIMVSPILIPLCLVGIPGYHLLKIFKRMFP